MTRRLRWCWWVAVLLAGITLMSMAASFVWVLGWSDSSFRYYLYLEHGMLCINLNALGYGAISNPQWCGHFEVYRSVIYEPWTALPSFQASDAGLQSCKFPIHFLLLVLIPIVVYPVLPFTVRRERRKRGLCVRCAYNLTGNVSGICPECGKPCEPDASAT